MTSVLSEGRREQGELEPSGQTTATVGPRKARPVVWWASLGAAAVALQAYIYGSWFASDNFRRVVPSGANSVPSSDKAWAWVLQGVFTAAALFAVVYVVRGCVKQRRLTLEAKVGIAWLAVMWMDPMANYFRTQYFFNSYYINMGSWSEQIPGWISRGGGRLPFAFGINMAFYTTSVLVAVAGCRLMRTLRARRPQMGTLGLVLIAWALLSVVVFVVEDLLIRAGWLLWTGVPQITLWNGTKQAIPLTEVLVWGGTQTALATVLFLKEDRGTLFVERGLERVRASGWRRTGLTLLAVIGFATCAQAAYGLISAPLGFYVDPIPKNTRSYIRNGVCGIGTPYKCPAPGVPALLPGSAPGATGNLP